MKSWISILLLTLISFPATAEKFGTGADMSKLVAISTLLENPEDYLDKDVTVEGAIISVCKKRGCWMKLASDKKYQTLRIKVKDGDMVFPFNAKGKTAYATGKLVGMELSKEKAVAYLSHLAEEANEEFDKGSIKSGMTVYQLSPTGVTIAD